METVLVRWPEEAAAREALRIAGRPRVLLVREGCPPPAPVDDLEDWVRMPASDADLQARVEWLQQRIAPTPTRGTAPTLVRCAPPVLDDDGLLSTVAGWTSLSPVDARLTRALIDRYGAVVSRDVLAQAGWPEGAPGRNALDVHVLRLRRRLAPLGVSIRTVRSRGYLLEAFATPIAA